MHQTADHVRRQCLALGMDADEPLAALLIGLAEGQDETKRLIEEASRKIASADLGISPTAEAALLDRLGVAADRFMRIQAVHYLRAGSLRNVLIAASVLFAVSAACLGGGYWWGHSAAIAGFHATEAGLRAAFSAGPGEAALWLRRMELNPAGLKCQVEHVDGGRRVCDTSLWMDPAPQIGRSR